MKNTMLKQNILAAVLTAMTVALSILVVIPVPATNGIVTLCEVGIYTSALLYGRRMGLIVGGASGFLIDILSGYPIWCLFSLIIHGLQGFAVGQFSSQKHPSSKTMIVPLLIGSFIMVGGYCLATTLLFGWPAGLASIFSNFIQVSFGTVVTFIVVGGLAKLKPDLV